MNKKVIKEFEAYTTGMKEEIIVNLKKNILKRRLMKTMWITIWIGLLFMFYLTSSVCFMSEMQWLAWIYVIFFACLMVKFAEMIIKE